MPEHQDAAAVSSCQDDLEIGAGSVAACQQDATQRLPGVWQWEHLLPWGRTRADNMEATFRPRRSMTLAHLTATVFGRFLLPPLEELYNQAV